MSKEADKSKKVSITNIVNWITSHIWQSVLIALALFLVPLVIVHFLYKWNTGVWILASTWSSGDLITYIAGFEAFLGTVVLGAIAVKQNENVYDLNKRLLDIEEKSSLIVRYPNLEISKHSVEKLGFDDIFERNIALFCSKEFNDGLPSVAFMEGPTYFLLSFQVSNKSTSSVIISVHDVSISAFGADSKPFLFEMLSSEFHPKCLDLLPNNSNDIGIIIDASFANDIVYNGVLKLSVVNNAFEEFQYSVYFSILLENVPDITNVIIKDISRNCVK